LTIDEADKMIAAAEKSGAKLMIGQLERLNPAMGRSAATCHKTALF
jgi:predicted dehydrogenase